MRKLTNGRPLILTKAMAIPKIPKITVIKSQIPNFSIKNKIKEMAAGPARYRNCFKVKGPIILSSISMNWGTWYCIIASLKSKVKNQKSK